MIDGESCLDVIFRQDPHSGFHYSSVSWVVFQLESHLTPGILDDESRNYPSNSSTILISSDLESFFFPQSFFGKFAKLLKHSPFTHHFWRLCHIQWVVKLFVLVEFEKLELTHWPKTDRHSRGLLWISVNSSHRMIFVYLSIMVHYYLPQTLFLI